MKDKTIDTSVGSPSNLYRVFGTWFFALVLLPFLLLALLEGGLRVMGYGEHRAPFLEKRVDGFTLYRENVGFFNQFYTKPLGPTYWEKSSFSVLKPKAENTVRVFVLGGSAVYGWPRQEYGVSRILQVFLKQYYPDQQVEVYNAAFPGMNSNVMRPMLEACLELEPDAFILAMGNNEYRGPFGLWDSFSQRNTAVPVPLVRWAMRLQGLRLYQAVINFRQVFRSDQKERKGLVEFSPIQAQSVRNNFYANLSAMVQQASKEDVPVIVTTLSANLRHWPPVPEDRPSASEVLPIFGEYVAQGQEALAQKDFQRAIELFERAVEIEARDAHAHFVLAQAYEGAEQYEKAKAQYKAALEYDSLTWVRCRRDIDQVIRQVAEEARSERVRLADAAGTLEAASPHGIPGAELYVDSCHTNFKGSYLMAQTIFTELRHVLRSPESELSSPLIDQATCARYLGLTAQDEVAMLENVRDSQIKVGANARAIYEDLLVELRARAQLESVDSRIEGLQEGLEVLGVDYYRQRALLEALIQESASKPLLLQQARVMVKAFPYYRKSYQFLGEALIAMGYQHQGRNAYKYARRIYEDDVTCLERAGDAAFQAHDYREANRLYRSAIKLDPERLDLWDSYGRILLAQGEVKKALEVFWRTADDGAMVLASCRKLVEIYQEQGKLADLEKLWREAIQAAGKLDQAYVGLGALAQAQGRLEEALAHYDMAHQQLENPAMIEAHLISLLRELAQKAIDKDQQAKALSYCDKILALEESNEIALAMRADVLAKQGGEAGFQAALEAYQKALEKRPWDYQLHERLSTLFLDRNDLPGLIQLWQECIEKNPQRLWLHYSLGSAHEQNKDWAQAIQSYRQALVLDPRSVGALEALSRVLTNRATQLEKEGRKEEALALSEEALGLDVQGKQTKAHWLRSVSSPQDSAAFKEAVEALRGAINAEPWNYPLYEDLCELYLERNDLPALVREWEGQIQQYPKRLLAHFNLGLAWERMKNLEAAIESYEEAYTLDERAQGTRDALNRVMKKEARRKVAAGAGAKALVLCQRAEDRHLTDADWVEIKSSALYENQDNVQALGVLRQAIAKQPQMRRYYVNLEAYYIEQGDFSGLVEEWRTLLEKDAENTYLYYYLALALEGLGNGQEAEAALRKALALEPENEECQKALVDLVISEAERLLLEQDQDRARKKLVALGDLPYRAAYRALLSALLYPSLEQEEWDSALAAIQQHLEEDSRNGLYYEALEKLFLQKESWNDLLPLLEEQVKQEAENAVAHNYLGQAQEKAGLEEKALASYEKACKLDATVPRAQENLERLLSEKADRLLRQKDYPGLLALCAQREAQGKEKTAWKIRKASALAQSGRQAEALSLWRVVASEAPWTYPAYEGIADYYLAQDDLDGLVREWETMLAEEPDCLLAHFSLALALERQGNLVGALAGYEKALELGPDASGTQEALLRIQKKIEEKETAGGAEVAPAEAP